MSNKPYYLLHIFITKQNLLGFYGIILQVLPLFLWLDLLNFSR